MNTPLRFSMFCYGQSKGNRMQIIAPGVVPHLPLCHLRRDHRSSATAVAESHTRSDCSRAYNPSMSAKGQPRCRARQLSGRPPQQQLQHLVHAAAAPARPDEMPGPAATKPADMLEDIPVVEASMYTAHSWRWRGYNISYAVAGCGPPVLLVHGFGASLGHYRKNIPALAENHQVWAVDLLGQGASDKPAVLYSMELWGELLGDFVAEFLTTPPVLIGNSVGSLACLIANAALPEDQIAGTVLINCAGGMNNKAVVDDWRIRLAMPIFWLIDFLLSKPRIARYLFDRFRTRDNLRKILKNVYTDPQAVDDALIDLLYNPSCSEGALEAFVSIITGPPGPSPSALVPRITGPLLVLWGDSDVFTPIDGPVGKMFKALPETRPSTAFRMLSGENHCVHDDNPALVNGIITKWLSEEARWRA